LVRNAIRLPLIAAGGVATGEAMLAVFALGAEGVQVGSRFVASIEASCHQAFKEEVLQAQEGSTELTLKELTPVRLLKNAFYQEIKKEYEKGATPEILAATLGKGRAKKGMFEGDLEEGELEIGQVAALIDTIIPAEQIVREMLSAYNSTLTRLYETGPFDL
jgi:enoyl-[acyl-carrier protein] reductase II